MFCSQCGTDLSDTSSSGVCPSCGLPGADPVWPPVAAIPPQPGASAVNPWGIAPTSQGQQPASDAQPDQPAGPQRAWPPSPVGAPSPFETPMYPSVPTNDAGIPFPSALPSVPPPSYPVAPTTGASSPSPTASPYVSGPPIGGVPPTGQAPLQMSAPGAGVPRSRMGLTVGAVGVVMLLLVGLVVIRGVNGQSAGSSSPENLVDQLKSALNKKDPAAAIALLDPSEVPALGDLYKTTVEKVRSGQDVDVPKSFDALKVQVSGVSHTTTYLDQQHQYAKVSFQSGVLDWSTEPSKLPDGVKRRMTENGESLPQPESGSTSTSDLSVYNDSNEVIDPFLVLVKEDGRWYISVSLTIAQYAVEVGDLPAGQFDNTPQPGPPAASPEVAIRTMLDVSRDAINKGSGSAKGANSTLSGFFPEAQTRVMRIYSKAARHGFDEGVSSGFANDSSGSSSSSGDEGFTGLAAECDGCGVEYSNLKVSTVKQGSLTYAVITSLDVEVKYQSCSWSSVDMNYDDSANSTYTFDPGEDPNSQDCAIQTEKASWDGRCLTYSGSDSDGSGNETRCVDEKTDADELNAADFGITDVHVVVKQERGGWVIDPVATLFDYGRTVLSHLDDPKVKRILLDEH